MANFFTTVNRFISRLDSDPSTISPQNPSQPASFLPSNSYGFQVLANTSTTPLEPYFDFIIGINNRSLSSPSHQLFSQEIQNSAGGNISLGIWSAKGGVVREEYLSVPAAGSGGLGLSLQWTALEVVGDVWHILDVMPQSPADVTGLLPYSDYVVGSSERTLRRGEGGLGELVEGAEGREVGLWVYNSEYDVVREIKMVPKRGWGGEGLLGCVLGYGALHRLPAPLGEAVSGPGETMFESSPAAAAPITGHDEISAEYLVPANMQMPAPMAGGQPPPPMGGARTKKQRAHHAVSPSAGMDEYFKEGEAKSAELDGGRSTPKTPGSLPPPPPKAGSGPPKGPPKGGTPPKAAVEAESEQGEEA